MIEVVNVEIPILEKTRQSNNCKYPFRALNVGQSFFIAAKPARKLSYAYTIIKYWKNILGNSYDFAAAKLDDGRIQIWRIL